VERPWNRQSDGWRCHVLEYEDGESNVTVSNGEGRIYTMPLVAKQDSAILHDGSGTGDGRTIANVRYTTNLGNSDLSGSSDKIMVTRG
jgi:hypothetical protein